MRNQLLLCVAVAVVAAIVHPSIASAGNAFGTWKSTSGSKFVIPESKTDFDLIMTRSDGSRDVYKAQWFSWGNQFVYGDDNACVAKLDDDNNDLMTVACKNQPTQAWMRVAVQKERPGGVVGTWHSTSGFHFAIPKFKRDKFDILMTSPTGDKTLFEAHWVDNKIGTQFIMGAYMCTFDADDPDEIRVVSPDDKFIWQRE